MSKKSLLPQTRRHILVYDEDWEFLQANYGPDSQSKLGVSEAIRKIIHQRVLGLKAQAQTEFDRLRGQQAPRNELP